MDNISKKEVLFGVPFNFPKSRVIKVILLLVEYYIHRQKLSYNGELSLMQWLQELKARLAKEKWICSRLGTPRKFSHWSKFMAYLS